MESKVAEKTDRTSVRFARTLSATAPRIASAVLNYPSDSRTRAANPSIDWIPPIFWAACIFVLSSSIFSSANTAGVIVPVLHWLMPAASPGTIVATHYFIRKLAHFSEYALLFLLLIRGPMRGRPGFALGLCAAYALLDEGHQMLMPSRTPSLHDVALDFSGALFSNLARLAVSALAKA